MQYAATKSTVTGCGLQTTTVNNKRNIGNQMKNDDDLRVDL